MRAGYPSNVYGTQEAYKQVYNWQFVHSVDFWALVLARGCEDDKEGEDESELRPLIYPLVQIGLGAVGYVPCISSKIQFD
jgi:nucleolar complex protein 2